MGESRRRPSFLPPGMYYKTCRRTHTHRSPLCAFTVRIARGVDPRPSELSMTYTIGKVDDSPYASRLCLSLAQTVPREPADYPRRAGSDPPSRKPCDQNWPQE